MAWFGRTNKLFEDEGVAVALRIVDYAEPMTQELFGCALAAAPAIDTSPQASSRAFLALCAALAHFVGRDTLDRYGAKYTPPLMESLHKMLVVRMVQRLGGGRTARERVSDSLALRQEVEKIASRLASIADDKVAVFEGAKLVASEFISGADLNPGTIEFARQCLNALVEGLGIVRARN